MKNIWNRILKRNETVNSDVIVKDNFQEIQTTDTVPFCINCKHFMKKDGYNEYQEILYGVCCKTIKPDYESSKHRHLTESELVTGHVQQIEIRLYDKYYHASTVRTVESECGYKGKWFEKK